MEVVVNSQSSEDYEINTDTHLVYVFFSFIFVFLFFIKGLPISNIAKVVI